MRAGRFADALVFAERAVAGQRVCVPAHGMLATILLQLGRSEDADMVVSRALEYQGGSADAYDGLAHVSMLLGGTIARASYTDELSSWRPPRRDFGTTLPRANVALAGCLKPKPHAIGPIALDPTQYASYLLRSELRVQSQKPITWSNAVRTRSLPIGDRGRVPLGYALAKELDDLQRFDEAFRWFSEAASTRRRHLDYDVAADERKLKRIIEVFPQAPAIPPRGSDDESGRTSSLSDYRAPVPHCWNGFLQASRSPVER